MRIEVAVTQYLSGWLRVTDATDNTDLSGSQPLKLPQASGWVSGKLLTVKSQAKVGRAAPRSDAIAIATLTEAAFDADEFVENAQVLGCSGSWVLVDYDIPRQNQELLKALQLNDMARSRPGRFRVWVDQICAIQETSCSIGE